MLISMQYQTASQRSQTLSLPWTPPQASHTQTSQNRPSSLKTSSGSTTWDQTKHNSAWCHLLLEYIPNSLWTNTHLKLKSWVLFPASGTTWDQPTQRTLWITSPTTVFLPPMADGQAWTSGWSCWPMESQQCPQKQPPPPTDSTRWGLRWYLLVSEKELTRQN